MRLCITGHDFSGKSSLLKDIYRTEKRNDKLSYIHLSYREPTTFEFYKNTLMFDNFLMDRCYLDELIYPKVFNREPNLSLDEAKKLYELSVSRDIFTIIVECADDKELEKRVKVRGVEEESEVLKNLKFIRDEYKKLASIFGIAVMDTSHLTLGEEREYIKTLMLK